MFPISTIRTQHPPFPRLPLPPRTPLCLSLHQTCSIVLQKGPITDLDPALAIVFLEASFHSSPACVITILLLLFKYICLLFCPTHLVKSRKMMCLSTRLKCVLFWGYLLVEPMLEFVLLCCGGGLILSLGNYKSQSGMSLPDHCH